MAVRTFRATYGRKPCRAISSADGRWFTVLLDQDPGYGSMIFTRIYWTEVHLIEEIEDARPNRGVSP